MELLLSKFTDTHQHHFRQLQPRSGFCIGSYEALLELFFKRDAGILMRSTHRFKDPISESVVSHIALGIRDERVIEAIANRVVALSGPDMASVMDVIDHAMAVAASEGNHHPQIQTAHLKSRFGDTGSIISVGCDDIVARLRARLAGDERCYTAHDSPSGSSRVMPILI